ncbi:FAD/NAD(P)-binding domain-containing protein [Gymnopus androsaceus JB14]|uniref:FAD/NAD(P)-binding domain-containing protein n=1 Tax=Gymnopus androsaceus JB14 TaxID=1447944 RepID=A0A6A4IBF2_9AGAR|nr:FAD/NAD(P)-binding domain-containing protein [Gymnopus androsaceus JB14]
MAVGTMEKIIDDDHAILSTVSGPDFIVSIIRYVSKDLLDPGLASSSNVMKLDKARLKYSRTLSSYLSHILKCTRKSLLSSRYRKDSSCESVQSKDWLTLLRLLFLSILCFLSTITPFCTLSSLEALSIDLDYVILGGGTAGLVTAARLSENPNVVVLVIEAGQHHVSVPEIEIPGYTGRNLARDGFDWTFVSVPQKHANDRVILQPKGKGLGGSSIINFLGLFKPSKQEMDALEALGNPGWNWESMLHYMQKSETLLPPTQLTDSEAIKYAAQPKKNLHGSEGPLKTISVYNTGNGRPTSNLADLSIGIGPRWLHLSA